MTPVVVTMGDPAGIGPELTLAAWARRESAAIPFFVVLGDPALFEQRSRRLGLDVPVRPVAKAGDAADVFPDALPVLPVPLPETVAAGSPDPGAASAILAAIETGVDLVCDGAASALVTNPINKALLREAGFTHPGHTEFLGELAGRRGATASPVMMLVCEAFRAVPATVHVPYKDVPGLLTRDLVIRTARVTREGLTSLFGIETPRIAVTGLNPHAGEEGTLGREEVETILPAIEALRAEGADVTGPHSADTIFQERLRTSYDAVVTMYHDQALIPVKTIAFDHAVNVTLGLPFVRTSPDHGTAYALAGTGEADPSSLVAALRLAGRLGAARKAAA